MRFGVGAIWLALVAGPHDEVARLEQLHRAELLRAVDELAVDVGARLALAAKLGDPTLEVLAGLRELRRVEVGLVLGERLRVRVREADGDGGLAVVDREPQQIRVAARGHVGAAQELAPACGPAARLR